ncbi:hypothetical protein L2E82_41077 [Cichorium intybus]|uniref:Uncharacterized protein n=1 Tax=Cichorium intybus TaxID=13427 RepID=A0ACB9AMJ7_CICIN|nr:hypothetical protein L2E82_41077 [Cichorium intybus]
MGNLCGGAKPPPPPPLNPKKTCSTKVVKSPERVTVRTHKRVNDEEGEEKRGILTLNECLVKPPNNKLGEHDMNAPKLQVVDARSQQSQVMSLPEVQTINFHSPMISLPPENTTTTRKLDKDERHDDEDDEGLIIPILKRNGSHKLEKTVKFKENDIFFFYSPVTFLEDT